MTQTGLTTKLFDIEKLAELVGESSFSSEQRGLFRREQCLSPAQINRYQPRHALFNHRHAEQAVHPAHRDCIVRDDQIDRKSVV